MNEPIASVKLGLEKENIAEYYNKLMLSEKIKRINKTFDIYYIVLGIVFTVCVIGYIASGGYVTGTMKLIAAVVYYLIFEHFIKRVISKRRFVRQMTESLNKGVNESDHTDFYEDRLIVYKSRSKLELFYSDITKLGESETLVFIQSKLGAHIFRRDRFYRGGFDDVKPKIIDLMKN